MPHFFSNSPGQSYHFWRICREYKCFTFARYSPQCESSIIFATPHERPRMLTNTYEYLAIILRSLRLVANCIRKPIRHIFATIWRICREYIFLHYYLLLLLIVVIHVSFSHYSVYHSCCYVTKTSYIIQLISYKGIF